MSTLTSQITSLTIVYSTAYSRCRSKKTSKLRVTVFYEENLLVTGEVPTQRASKAENISIRWRQDVKSGYSRVYLQIHLQIARNDFN